MFADAPDVSRLEPWNESGYVDTDGLPIYSIVEKDGQTWFQVEYGASGGKASPTPPSGPTP